MKRVLTILFVCLCLTGCNKSAAASSSELSFPSEISEPLTQSSSMSGFSSEPVLIKSFEGSNRYVKRIDIKQELIGTCAYIILYDIDWNSLEFNQRGEIAVEALQYSYGVLEKERIEIVSSAGFSNDGDMLFSLTDGLGNIIIWDIGQKDFTYDSDDIYIWQ